MMKRISYYVVAIHQKYVLTSILTFGEPDSQNLSSGKDLLASGTLLMKNIATEHHFATSMMNSSRLNCSLTLCTAILDLLMMQYMYCQIPGSWQCKCNDWQIRQTVAKA